MQMLGDKLHDVVMADRPGGGNNGGIGAVVLVMELANHRRRHRTDRLDASGNLSSQRMARKPRSVEKLVAQLIRFISAHSNLFENHSLF